MAAAGPLQNIKAEVTCPICLELFQDPVTGECGHSFCRECITRLCQGEGDVACPQCRKKFQKENLRPNRELRNMVESLLRSQTGGEPRGGPMCEGHQEPLKLYCKEDQTPICVVCERSQAHRGHLVVPVEEAVQAHWETMKKQLAGIESTYRSLHPLVSLDRKHLSPSAGEEMHRRLKRLAENLATLFKVHTEGPRQRFADAASQTQPHEPDRRGRGRGVATRSELQECQGREPGSEREHGRRQASLDPIIHTISSTTGAAQCEAYVMAILIRFLEWLSPVLWEICVRDHAGVSPAGQGAAQIEWGGDTGRGGRESQDPEAAAAGVPTKAKPPPLPLKWQIALPPSETQQPADAPSRGDSLQGQGPLRPASPSEGSGGGFSGLSHGSSPARRV